MIAVLQLGKVEYELGLRLQKSLVALRQSGRIPNLVLLLEHPPVITLGRHADRRHLLASPDVLRREGVEVFDCDRGGDITYHGPGQLVGYPIFDLRSFPLGGPEEVPATNRRKTLGAVDYVRRLEEVLIRTCADFGLAAERMPKLTGVWTRTAGTPTATADSGSQAKVAAIGVHIARGVTSHGFALNVDPDLRHFDLIVPCGIATKAVTSLSKETGTPVAMDAVAESVARNFGRVFHCQILWVDTLDALLGRAVGVPVKPPEELRRLHKKEDSFWV